jgi:hypothetical protein
MHKPSSGATESRQTDDAALRIAEERAERAEKKVEQLDRAVAALKAEPGRSSATDQSGAKAPQRPADAMDQLRQEPMMAHLAESLEKGMDIGHYGRLVFAMVARHFMTREQLLDWLDKDPNFGHDQATALLRQVSSHDYNPPRRERILAWQAQQDFPIIPTVDDPDCGNVYRNLKFPDQVYEHIEEYQEEKAGAERSAGSAEER